MKQVTGLFIVMMMVVCTGAAATAQEKPAAKEKKDIFGLPWGITHADAKKVVSGMTVVEHQGTLTLYGVKVLPKGLPGFASYALLFSSKYGLVKVVAVSSSFTEDAYGIAGTKAFEELAAALTKKYKRTDTARHIHLKLFTKQEEFYECLRYGGCGMWTDIYSGEDRTIVLDLKGERSATGYLRLSVEAVPGMADALKEQEKFKDSAVDDAL